MRVQKLTSTILAASLALAFLPSVAFAQDYPPSPCTGDAVSGTVIAVDTTLGIATIQLADGSSCTVDMTQSYSQPIIGLLANFFETTTPDSLATDLSSLQTTIVCDPVTGACSLASAGETGTSATVQSVTDNGDGTFTVTLAYTDGSGATSTTTITVDDPAQAQTWTDSLSQLQVSWNLTTDASGNSVYSGAGEEITSLHDSGMGFGVIVKLYAMADQANQACQEMTASGTTADGSTDGVNPCDVSLQSLVDAFQSGTGMGQLFKEYGKPSYLGVGHVRNGLPQSGKPENPGNGKANNGSKGLCNAQAHGGNAHANGHGPTVVCPDGGTSSSGGE